MSAVLNDQITSSTDATRGWRLADRVLARKHELEDALAEGGSQSLLLRTAITTALTTVYALLAHPAERVARDLERWLERNKHLAR